MIIILRREIHYQECLTSKVLNKVIKRAHLLKIRIINLIFLHNLILVTHKIKTFIISVKAPAILQAISIHQIHGKKRRKTRMYKSLNSLDKIVNHLEAVFPILAEAFTLLFQTNIKKFSKKLNLNKRKNKTRKSNLMKICLEPVKI